MPRLRATWATTKAAVIDAHRALRDYTNLYDSTVVVVGRYLHQMLLTTVPVGVFFGAAGTATLQYIHGSTDAAFFGLSWLAFGLVSAAHIILNLLAEAAEEMQEEIEGYAPDVDERAGEGIWGVE